MPATIRQRQQQFSTASSSRQITLDGGLLDAGDTIIAIVHTTGAKTPVLDQSGYIQHELESESQITLTAFSKVADGTESVVRASWSGGSICRLVVIVVAGLASPSFDVSESATSSTADVNAQSTGTTPTTGQANTWLLGIVGTRQSQGDGGWSNSFVTDTHYTPSISTIFATREVSAVGTYETTWTFTGAAAQARGIILAFRLPTAEAVDLEFAGALPGLAGSFDLVEVHPFQAKMLALNPLAYWRVEEVAGPTAVDWSGNDHHGTFSGDVEHGVPGLMDPVDLAVRFGVPDSGESGYVWWVEAGFEWTPENIATVKKVGSLRKRY